MKYLIFVLCLLVLFSVQSVQAQTTYEVLLDDYREGFDDYIEARDDYLVARGEYLQYKTLVSQSNAIDKTQIFLQTRQQVLIRYLQMIKNRLEQSTELTDDELKEFLLYVNNEIEFLQEKEKLFYSANTLKDLERVSDEIEKEYNEFVLNAYRMKSLIVDSKVRSLRKTADELINLTGEQVARIRKEGILDTTDIDRWLVEAPNRLVFAKENEEQALSELANLRGRQAISIGGRSYEKFLSKIRVAGSYILESQSLLLQIVHNIRFR